MQKQPLFILSGRRDSNADACGQHPDEAVSVIVMRQPLTLSGRRDSNSRHRPWKGRALPTELLPQFQGAKIRIFFYLQRAADKITRYIKKADSLFSNGTPVNKCIIFKIEPGIFIDPFFLNDISCDFPIGFLSCPPTVSYHFRIHTFPYLSGN